MGFWNITRNEHIVKIWLAEPCMDNGNGLSKIWKFFIMLMNLSTWILSDDIPWLMITCCAENCGLSSKNIGILNFTPISSKRSRIVKPLSALSHHLYPKTLGLKCHIWKQFLDLKCSLGIIQTQKITHLLA